MKFGDPGTERISKPEIIESTNNIAKRNGFYSYTIEVLPLSTISSAYLGEYYNINIIGKTKDGDKTINMFVKTILPCETIEFIPLKDSYLKEVLCYTVLRESFMDLQDYYEVPLKDRFQMIHCYDTVNNDTLLLENVALQGFKNYDKFKIAPLRFLELTIEGLAKFHSMSFVLQKERPQIWLKLKNMKEMKSPYNWNKQWREFRELSLDNAIDVLDSDEAKSKMEKFRNKYLDDYQKYHEVDNCSPVVISHGDYRIGNMMYREENNKIKDVHIVDFQLLYFSNPVNDLLFLLIGNTDQEMRKDYMKYFPDLYYTTMQNFLSYFDIDCEEVYPRKMFEKNFKERLEFGLMVAITFLPFYLPHVGETPDLASQECTAMTFPKHDIYTKRVRGLVDDFIQWGYL